METIKRLAKKHLPRGLLRASKAAYMRLGSLPRRMRLKGDRVRCPCCGHHFSGFDTFVISAEQHGGAAGQNARRDVVCPYCGSYPRHRIVCDYLDKNALPRPSDKVLIFAPAYAYRIWFKRRKRSFLSADLFERSADVRADIQHTPFADGAYDFISCDHVLEHVDDDGAALRELLRIVRPGGCVELSVPLLPDRADTYEDPSINDPAGRAMAFGQSDHLRLYGRDFADKLRRVGFVVTMCDGDACDPAIVPVTGPAVFDYNQIFLCKKPL